MKFKIVIFLLVLVSSYSYACGLHQSTGFNFVTEPGSLEVFENVIAVRQSNALGNVKKPEHFLLYSFKGALNKPYSNRINFSIFEAIKGHYSEVTFGYSIDVLGRDTLPTGNDVLLITELDVLDALATRSLSWSQAKEQELVKVNGQDHDVDVLDNWFTALFPDSIHES
ncbi:hypothetical protein [Vibrio sp. VB16]|uniref:hypothetical protein n=1 Tax=Vibrio sp. VB16 TaxID=2785746 RepID=UPI0018A01C1B|nr:hypothetical protein [Vibrio sp. VB16]UGA57403.1 hypothetical protein IUZ65_018060 [Vibrio sp. VB16]